MEQASTPPYSRGAGMTKRDAPATHRNREPILARLEHWLDRPATVLEVASGTGQHAVFFAEKLPHLVWQPTDGDPSSLESISAWAEESGLPNLRPPLLLDASGPQWPVVAGEVDAIFNANMIHIAPWTAAVGLLAGAGRILPVAGRLFLYGPFEIDGVQTSPSNAAFDESLRARDPSWGVRALEDVCTVADASGLVHEETADLPANNKLVVFRKT
jgi:SAM-dependent methyltransferase